jgi:vacuolar iron transporter family protein
MSLEDRVVELERHIKEEHKQSALGAHLKDIIYGGVDGIVTTFAVVAGFSGAALTGTATTQLSSLVLLLFGLANLFADAISMGLGNFLSIRSDQSLYKSLRAKEERETLHNGEVESEETVTILMEKGFVEADAREITKLYRKNPNYWIDFMMNNELQIPDPRGAHPVYAALATFTAFISFGIVPLFPFLFLHLAPTQLFLVSSVGTGLALILLGSFKAYVIGGKPFGAILETVAVGGAAALVAFFVGSLFSY